MYDVMILNFGDAMRVFYDSANIPVSIGIGEVRECTLDDVTAQTLFRGQRTDTICLLRRHVDVPSNVKEMFTLLRGVMTRPYEEVLSEASRLVGRHRFESPRPTRMEIRSIVGNVVRGLCADLTPATPMASIQAPVDDPDSALDPDEADDAAVDDEPETPVSVKKPRAAIKTVAKSKTKRDKTRAKAKKGRR